MSDRANRAMLVHALPDGCVNEDNSCLVSGCWSSKRCNFFFCFAHNLNYKDLIQKILDIVYIDIHVPISVGG